MIAHSQLSSIMLHGVDKKRNHSHLVSTSHKPWMSRNDRCYWDLMTQGESFTEKVTTHLQYRNQWHKAEALTRASLNCHSKADDSSEAVKCITFTFYYAPLRLKSTLPLSLDFNELSLSQLWEKRARVHIPDSVQTHKTLTSSLCGALQGCSMPL